MNVFELGNVLTKVVGKQGDKPKHHQSDERVCEFVNQSDLLVGIHFRMVICECMVCFSRARVHTQLSTLQRLIFNQ